MEQAKFCQSCGMPMEDGAELFGTEKDGSKNSDYCHYCYTNGAFTSEQTMDAMIESCIPFVVDGKPYANAEEARTSMQAFFPTLKRWQK